MPVTREGRLQVQLAQLHYLLPPSAWHVESSRQRNRRAVASAHALVRGESQLVDRRLIRNKIAALRRELKQVEQRRDVQSKSRIESPAFRVALAGYTNAGKSTLLNRLTGSTVLSQDKLFVTLDPTTPVLPAARRSRNDDYRIPSALFKEPHGWSMPLNRRCPRC